MDDRTTIASGMFLAWFQAMGSGRKRIGAAEMRDAACICLNNADALIDCIENSRVIENAFPAPTATPHPKPSIGPRWRKMDDVPNKPTHCIMYQYRTHFCVFWDMNKWVWEDNKDKAVNDMRGAYWLDLNGFTPEVSE